MRFTWFTYAKAIHNAEIEFNKAFVEAWPPYAAVLPNSPLSIKHHTMVLLKNRLKRERVRQPARMIREIYQIVIETRNPLP